VHHHLITAQAMAYQNAIWLIETAKCGFEDGNRMFGHSLIVAPTGEIAAKSLSEEDEVICVNADLDLAADLEAYGVQLRSAPPPRALQVDRRARRRGNHAGKRPVAIVILAYARIQGFQALAPILPSRASGGRGYRPAPE
jgi:hypothetical protein